MVETGSAAYNRAHHHTRRERGLASNYTCSDCNRPGYAWAEIHESDPVDYKPMCQSCHIKYDMRPEWRGKLRTNNAKLKKSDISEIIDKRQNGYSAKDLAEIYGVTPHHIRKIVNRTYWWWI